MYHVALHQEPFLPSIDMGLTVSAVTFVSTLKNSQHGSGFY